MSRKGNPDISMLNNTLAQLEDDILSYEWLHALASYHEPDSTSQRQIEMVRQTVLALLSRGTIILGDALQGGFIRPWSDSAVELADRVNSTIDSIGVPTNEKERFVFWIGLSSCLAE